MSEVTASINTISNGYSPILDGKDQEIPLAVSIIPQPTANVTNEQHKEVVNGSHKVAEKSDSDTHPAIAIDNVKKEVVTKKTAKSSSDGTTRKSRKNRELSAITKDAITNNIVEYVGNGESSKNGANGQGKATRKRGPKRSSSIASSNDTTDSSDCRVGKRVRLQHQPFQSAVVPQYYRTVSHPPKPQQSQEERVILFNKGEFLAVRNEFGSFYICRSTQNVYKNSKKFKIQWFNDDKDIYTADFFDSTDIDCVLTKVQMERLANQRYKLPSNEKQRILNILERALNIEKGVVPLPDPKQVVADGIDLSIVGKEDEQEVVQLVKSLKKEVKKESEVKSSKESNIKSEKKVVEEKPLGRTRKGSMSSSKKTEKPVEKLSVVESKRKAELKKTVLKKTTTRKEVPSKNNKKVKVAEKDVKKNRMKESTVKRIQVDDDDDDTEEDTSIREPPKKFPPPSKLKNANTNKSDKVENSKPTEQKPTIQPKPIVTAKEDTLSKLAKKNQELRKIVESKKALKKSTRIPPIKSTRIPLIKSTKPTRSSRLTRNIVPDPPLRSPVKISTESTATKSKRYNGFDGSKKPLRVEKKPTPQPQPKTVKEAASKTKLTKPIVPNEKKQSVDIFQLIGLDIVSSKSSTKDTVIKSTENKFSLESAIRMGDFKTANECIKSGGEPREKLVSLAFLAAAHCPQILSTLINEGISVNALNPETGNNFLHILAATKKKTSDIIAATQHLLSVGADVNQTNLLGKIPLHVVQTNLNFCLS